jgi:radical SAM superfamily enzyme YgiQ (UPF0313 family)
MSGPLVTLFMPKRYRPSQLMPLELLALAGPLLEKGYKVEIIDANVHHDYTDLLSVACPKSICFGISCMLGYQILHGMQTAQKIRHLCPSLPIIWGGWFPSVMPKPFLDEGVADLVVIGQGEKTFLEVVEGIAGGISREVPGTASKSNGQVRLMPPRGITHLEDLPPMPFSLLDYERYYRSDPRPMPIAFWSMAHKKLWQKQGMRLFHYMSSWGCPNNCGFCCSPGVTRRRWTALSPKRILDELGPLTVDNKVDAVFFCDPNFFVDRKRVLEICRLKEDLGLGFPWFASACPDMIARMSGSELESLSRSGCFGLYIGAESGSKETLNAMNKQHHPKDNELCTELLVRHQMVPVISWIVGIPGEDPRSINATIEQCRNIKSKYIDVMVHLYYYVPLPGTRLYHASLEEGFAEPKGLKEWGEIGGVADYPFKRSPHFHNVEKSQRKIVSRVHLFGSLVDLPWFSQKLGTTEKLLRSISLVRIKHGFLFLPFEPLALKVKVKLTKIARHVRMWLGKERPDRKNSST